MCCAGIFLENMISLSSIQHRVLSVKQTRSKANSREKLIIFHSYKRGKRRGFFFTANEINLSEFQILDKWEQHKNFIRHKTKGTFTYYLEKEKFYCLRVLLAIFHTPSFFPYIHAANGFFVAYNFHSVNWKASGRWWVKVLKWFFIFFKKKAWWIFFMDLQGAIWCLFKFRISERNNFKSDGWCRSHICLLMSSKIKLNGILLEFFKDLKLRLSYTNRVTIEIP